MAGEVALLYFASVRERIGRGEEQVHLPVGIDRVDRLIDWLIGRGQGYEAALARREVVRCAVNQEIASEATPIAAGDEVAFFPPVTGG